MRGCAGSTGKTTWCVLWFVPLMAVMDGSLNW